MMKVQPEIETNSAQEKRLRFQTSSTSDAKWRVSSDRWVRSRTQKAWQDQTWEEKAYQVLLTIIRFFLFMAVIFGIICNLSLLAVSFQLIGGSGMGKTLKESPFLKNQISAAILGMVVTLVLQSGSTLISILVGMVAGDLLTVHQAIPVMMGSEMGASLINALVSLGHSGDRDEFRRAFAAATMNDIFNFMNFITVLPLEMSTGFMEWFSGLLVQPLKNARSAEFKTLQYLTDPLLSKIIMIDEKALTRVTAMSRNSEAIPTTRDTFVFRCVDLQTREELPFCPYSHIFARSFWSDSAIGLVLLVSSIVALGLLLLALVQVIQSLMAGRAAVYVRRLLEQSCPHPFECFTGYLIMLVACVIVIIVQSSSVFRSALTPMVGVGIIPLHRLYPLLLGANIGTTSTGVLAALSADPSQLQETLQIALCQTLFNLLGILFFYPIPFLRRIPLKLCMALGNITAKYRWFALAYILSVFFTIPATLLLLSVLPTAAVFSVVGLSVLFVGSIAIINCLQSGHPAILPRCLRTWDCLPLFMHDLDVYDRFFRKMSKVVICCPRRFFNPKLDEGGPEPPPRSGSLVNGPSRNGRKTSYRQTTV